MEYRRVFVYYWKGSKPEVLPWEHGEEIDYSLRFYVLQRCIDSSYNTMYTLSEDGNINIMIDNGRFRQS